MQRTKFFAVDNQGAGMGGGRSPHAPIVRLDQRQHQREPQAGAPVPGSGRETILGTGAVHAFSHAALLLGGAARFLLMAADPCSKGRKMRSSASCGMPGPVSSTITTTSVPKALTSALMFT